MTKKAKRAAATRAQLELMARIHLPEPWPQTKRAASQAIAAHLEAMRVARMRNNALSKRLSELLDE